MSSDSAQLNRILRALRSSVVELNADYHVAFSNHSGALLSVGDRYFEKVPADVGERARRVFEQVLADGIPRPFEGAQAGRLFVTWVSRVTTDDGENRLILAAQDATDEQSAERVAEAERQQQHVALEASGVGLWSWHLPTDRVVWDERMRAITGRETPLSLPRWIEELTHPDDRDAVRSKSSSLGQLGRFSSDLSRILRPDGEVRWVLSSGVVIAGAEGEPEWVVGGLMDVTSQQRTEEKLRVAHRMEAVAQLTSGVAHNFNNMLMIIAPALDVIRGSVPEDLLADVEDAIRATERASDIVSQLMTFSGRRNSPEQARRMAADLCEETVRLCRRSFPPEVELRMDSNSHAELLSTPGSIEQVLSNVIFNARDAVVDGAQREGRVSLSVRDIEYFGEDWIEITITDNGPGVAEELRARIFEPFVTSKKGAGTGLGLASSMALVQQHGGQLVHRPAPDGGAQFLILLPQATVADDPPVSVERSSPRAAAEAQVRGRVLVIDDEPAIRRLLKGGLSRLGFQVTSLEGPEQVKRRLEERRDFEFVLLDRSLGTEDGRQLLPLLRKCLPSARIYFFTGEYVDDSEAALVEGVVQKPTNMKALASVIDEALSA